MPKTYKLKELGNFWQIYSQEVLRDDAEVYEDVIEILAMAASEKNARQIVVALNTHQANQ